MPVMYAGRSVFQKGAIHFCSRDGLSAVREIRRLEETGFLKKRTLIFALTGNAREGQIDSAREAGMDDVIVCPLCS